MPARGLEVRRKAELHRESEADALSPRDDQAHAAAMMTAGAGVSILLAAIAKFGVLPALSSFPAFCIALGLFLLPVGFVKAYSRKPSILAAFSSMPLSFMALLAPTIQMSYPHPARSRQPSSSLPICWRQGRWCRSSPITKCGVGSCRSLPSAAIYDGQSARVYIDMLVDTFANEPHWPHTETRGRQINVRAGAHDPVVSQTIGQTVSDPGS